MTRWTRRLMMVFVLGLVAMLAIPEDAFAQRRGGGSRSRSSTSRSKPRASKPKNKASKSSKKSKKNQFGSSKNKSAKAKSKADRAAYEKAKKSGKAFPDRKSARRTLASMTASMQPSLLRDQNMSLSQPSQEGQRTTSPTIRVWAVMDTWEWEVDG